MLKESGHLAPPFRGHQPESLLKQHLLIIQGYRLHRLQHISTQNCPRLASWGLTDGVQEDNHGLGCICAVSRTHPSSGLPCWPFPAALTLRFHDLQLCQLAALLPPGCALSGRWRAAFSGANSPQRSLPMGASWRGSGPTPSLPQR